MRVKVVKGILLCALLLCVGMPKTQLLSTEVPTAQQKLTVQAAETTKKEKPVGFAKRIVLAPGDVYTLELGDYSETASIKVVSERPELVKVTKDGKLKALTCGSTAVKATITDGKKVRYVKVKINVRYDAFRQQLSNGQLLKKGNQRKLSLGNLASDAQIEYRSSKPEIASVSADGIVTAKQNGTAKITIVVRQAQKKYVFYDRIHVYEQTAAKVTKKVRDEWFSDSGFVGSSMGVGQKMYFQSQGAGYLGNPVMLVRGCYSFLNDASSSPDYKVTYNGTAYTARTAIKKSGIKKVFINMGMNDLWESPEKVSARYIDYLDGIRKENPKVVIFIESTTPVARGNESKKLSNKNVNRLNELMQTYCSSQTDMYYINVNSCLKDASGNLKSSYSSDQHVHLNMAGYAQWMNALCAYTDKLMIAQQRAEDAVLTALESNEEADYQKAVTLLEKLKDSTVKEQLTSRLARTKAIRTYSELEPIKEAEDETEYIVIEPEEKVEKLGQVQDVQVLAKSNTSLRLEWKKTTDAGYYRIYRALDKKGTYKQVAGTTKTAYVDTTCKKHTKYYYKIQAGVSKKDTSRDSKYSKIVACRTKNIPKKVVLAGDSIMEGMIDYDQVKQLTTPGKKYVVAARGLGTLSFQTKAAFNGATAVEKVISYKPDRLYLMLGMNELSYRNQKDMLRNYTEILDQLQEESPKTEIVLISVSPVSKGVAAEQKKYTGIKAWNESIKKLADTYDCYYMDCFPQLANADGYLKYNGGDGIHWSIKGYQAFVKKLLAFEKKLNG